MLAREWADREGIAGDPLTALAAAVGISRAAIFRYVPGVENPAGGKARPSADTLILMAHVLGIPLDRLMSWQIIDTRTGDIVRASS